MGELKFPYLKLEEMQCYTETMAREKLLCLLDQSPHDFGVDRRTCPNCRIFRSREYRQTAIGYVKSQLRYQSIKGTNLMRAKSQVYIAVRSGALPPVRTLKCADCGLQAQEYDHRDYLKPLEVQPVCRSCNSLRGPGLNRR